MSSSTQPARHNTVTRRTAISQIAAGLAGTAGLAMMPAASAATLKPRASSAKPLFSISLAEWSLNPLLYGDELTNLEFPAEARRLGFEAVEYVNGFFKDKARDRTYLDELNSRANDAGTKQLLIMIDGEGRMGAPDHDERGNAIDNHVRWLEAAAQLGCHSIRVNAASEGEFDEQQRLAADGLRRLTEIAAGTFDLNVIVENHGGFSSNGQWMAGVMKLVDHPRCGTLPDFGNFCFDWSKADDPEAWYDRYKGVSEMMPFAKAVSAKSYEFDDDGNEVRTDYRKMVKIVTDAGYRGYIGVEYEGKKHSPRDGSTLTRKLLEAVRDELAQG